MSRENLGNKVKSEFNFDATYEINIDKMSKLLMYAKSNNSKGSLTFELPNEKRSVKAQWTFQDMEKTGRLPDRIPVEVTIDNKQPISLEYRDRKLYQKGQLKPWSSPDLLFLKDAFSKLGTTEKEDDNISPRGFFDWAGCVSDFAGAGAGIGAVVGLIGGIKGIAGGAAVGGAAGAAFGLGACTAAEVDKALR